MTNDQDSSNEFEVVLIDIQKAAKGKIYCVKKPLSDQLEYVTISYRWGELQETSMNTQVGYVASITSFDIQDFYELCAAMTKEPTMATIRYVWVDAICVNQSNHDERKATIYHMNEIYERATWILAVPDLHTAHLRIMHRHVMDSIHQHQSYLYHLLQDNRNELDKMDQDFLDEIGVPQDPDLRELLTKYTRCFAHGFTEESYKYDDARLLSQLYSLYHPSTDDNDKHTRDIPKTLQEAVDVGIRMLPSHLLTQSVVRATVPQKYLRTVHMYSLYQQRNKKEWHKGILERSTVIRQAIRFLTDLVVDWSSRVWVISEFHISKKKNNLKFWFNQLNGHDVTAFFTFDMNDPRLSVIRKDASPNVIRCFGMYLSTVYLAFYRQLINQLDRQTFLEMMLKSKASRNEDRFYSILPLFPEYKPLLQNDQLVNNVHSLLSVKLKLYQVMTLQHKLMLFYISAKGKTTWTLPTFATSIIDWPHFSFGDHFRTNLLVNVDITLLREKTARGLYYLRLKPKGWANSGVTECTNVFAKSVLTQLVHLKKDTPSKDADTMRVNVVRIPELGNIWLMGSLHENKWILGTNADFDLNIRSEDADDALDDFHGFHVY